MLRYNIVTLMKNCLSHFFEFWEKRKSFLIFNWSGALLPKFGKNPLIDWLIVLPMIYVILLKSI